MVVRLFFATMPPAWPILVTMSASARLVPAREKASVILDEAQALLDPESDIDGLMLARLVDARLAQGGHADAAGRLAAALGEDALVGAVDTLHGLSAALDQIQRASVMTRTSGS